MSVDAADYLESARPWILVFAHPGHELRAHHVVERVRPSVAVLTDGSGSTNYPRLEESRALLARTGARPAAAFGPLTDRQAYAALMAGDPQPFLRQRDLLVDALLGDGIRALVADAAEGYNPVHDICHWICRAAVDRARQFGLQTDFFEVDLVSSPDAPGEGLRLVLDDQAFARKMEAIARYTALKHEADEAFARYGRDAFRVEFLRRVRDVPPPPSSLVPHYEQVGEARVRAGVYSSVLRYGSHVRPIVQSLLESVQPRDYATDFRTLNE